MRLNEVDFCASYGLVKQLPKSIKPEVAFLGKSNVGKSSMINGLCLRKNLARVSSQPGKTATINFYGNKELYLVDLPGYGYAKKSNDDLKRYSDLINGYLTSNRNLKLCVLLLDIRRILSETDSNIIQFLSLKDIPFIIAFTKSDKLNKTELKTKTEEINNAFRDSHIKFIITSSKTKTGFDKITDIIKKQVL